MHHIVPKHEDDRYDDKQRHESRVNYHDDDEDHHGGHGHGHGHGHEDHHEEHDHDHDDHHDEGHHKCDHDHHEDHHDDHDLHDDHHDEYDHHEEHEDFHRHCDRHEERHSDDAHHNDDVHLSEHSHHGAEQGYSRHDDDNDYPDHLNLNNDDDHSKSDRGNYHSPEHQKQELDVYKTGHRYSQEREHQDSHEYDGHSEYETVKTAEHADNHGSNHIASVPHITIALHDRSDGNPDHATNDNLIKKLIEQLTDSLNRFQVLVIDLSFLTSFTLLPRNDLHVSLGNGYQIFAYFRISNKRERLHTVEYRYLEYSIRRTLDVSNKNNRSHPYQFTRNDYLLEKSNSRCLEQICWSLDSSRYRELTVQSNVDISNTR